MISNHRAEEAFEYLRDTTEKIGAARGRLERSEILRKRARKRVFLLSEGTVAERDALAECDETVHASDDEYISAVQEFEALKAKREIESICLEVWRTESANRRKS